MEIRTCYTPTKQYNHIDIRTPDRTIENDPTIASQDWKIKILTHVMDHPAPYKIKADLEKRTRDKP